MPFLINRRRFLQASAAVAATGALALATDATVVEPNQPELVRVEVPLVGWPYAWDGFKIAQLSDFHYDEYFSAVPLRSAINIVNGLQPDLVVLTGDFVTVPVFADYLHNAERAEKDAEPCARLLGALRARFGVIAILGNHDLGSDRQLVTESLQSHDIPVLRNRSIPIEWEGSRIWLSGVDDVLRGKPDINRTLRAVPRNEPVVLLVHEPDIADQVALHSVNLQLSGHSHGGQIRFPLIGPPYLPKLAHKYPRGLYRIGPLTLYTNVGLGTVRLPMRFNCPPEITLLTLRAAAAASKEDRSPPQRTSEHMRASLFVGRSSQNL